jgi:hypothetical protein
LRLEHASIKEDDGEEVEEGKNGRVKKSRQ